jgi:phosphate/sulfate permease
MTESTHMLSQRESYAPTKWQEFLWWLSTVEKELIKDCVIDRNRYAIVGMSVLGTWLFATLAWTYFFSTTVSNIYASIGLGIFMGLIILSIDRMLIKGINSINKNKITALIFRFVLAITIGFFMAQPALLYLFDKEVHLQISLDNEQRKKDKLAQQESAVASVKNDLLNKRNFLQHQLDTLYKEVATARNNFIAETDGTGGSKKIGLKDIAQAKQNEYVKLDVAYNHLQQLNEPEIKTIDSSLSVMETNIQQEQQQFNLLLNDGFLSRIEALSHLIETNTAMRFRYYLLVALLMLIELMPVIAKILLPTGSYEEKVKLRDAMEKELIQQNMQQEQQLKELYNQLAFEQDSSFIKNFMTNTATERTNKLKTNIIEWKDNTTKSFDSFWNETKKEMLSKQEQ